VFGITLIGIVGAGPFSTHPFTSVTAGVFTEDVVLNPSSPLLRLCSVLY
jgi:hypothetical protein